MRIKRLAALVAVIALAFPLSGLAASGTSLFASEGNARSVCGPEHVVWVMLEGGKYYRAGSPGYEKAKDQQKGAYTCEKIARKEGGHLAADGR
jgi:hypothetical protein